MNGLVWYRCKLEMDGIWMIVIFGSDFERSSGGNFCLEGGIVSSVSVIYFVWKERWFKAGIYVDFWVVVSDVLFGYRFRKKRVG